MRILTVSMMVFALATSQAQDTAVLESVFSERDIPLNPDPNSGDWANAPRVTAHRDKSGEPIPGKPTEIRARWTKENLFLLYICPYDELNLKPNPDPSTETPKLWNWDVAEAFIGSDFERIGRYKEFQVSPQSEWVDLAIDRDDPKGQEGMKWNSGYAVKARIDAQAKIWYGIMRIPFAAIDAGRERATASEPQERSGDRGAPRAIVSGGPAGQSPPEKNDARPPRPGRELRIGLYRIAGVNPKKFYAWRPTGQDSFHVPQAFGILRLR